MTANNKKHPPIIHAYLWRGLNRKGEKVSGEYKGSSIKDVKQHLRNQGIHWIQLRKKPEPWLKIGALHRITAQDITLMTRQLATLLSAGVPVVESITIIAQGHDKAAMRTLLCAINHDIKSGVAIATVLGNYRRYFDDLYCYLVALGEQSGSLDRMCEQIAHYQEKQQALKSKIKMALLYPSAVIIIALGMILLLLIYVVPQFEAIFIDYNAPLPSFTQVVIAIANTIQTYGHVIVLLTIISGGLLKQAHVKYQYIRNKTDILLLKIPIVGAILRKSYLARLARTLATTFTAGVPLLDGLTSSAGASGNYIYRQAVLNARSDVESGLMLNIAMNNAKIFPNIFIQMIRIGEETGTIDDMLNKIATIYEMEVDNGVDGLTTLIEPIIIVVIGSVVGALIIAMYLPIFKMGSII